MSFSYRCFRYAVKPLPFFATSILLIGTYFTLVDLPKTLFYVIWGVPAYVVGTLLHIRYVWLVTKTTTSQSNSSDVRLNEVVAEVIYGAVLNLTYFAQTFLYVYLANALAPTFIAPVVASTINVCMIAWATSFTAFESKLITNGHDLGQRLAFIEHRWAYALGYGLMASLVYNFFPFAIAMSIWQYLQLLLTFRAFQTSSASLSKSRLRIFRIAKELATISINLVLSF